MKRCLFIIVCITLMSSNPVTAELNKSERQELFDAIERLCVDAKNVSEIIKYSGDLKAGAILRIVGLGAEGSIDISQYRNIEQIHGEFRSNPTICKFEMLKELFPLFSDNKGNLRPNAALLFGNDASLDGAFQDSEVLFDRDLRSFEIGPGNRTILTAGPRRGANLFEYPSFRELKAFRSLDANIVKFSGLDNRIYGTSSGRMSVWSADTGKKLSHIFGTDAEILDNSLSKSGKTFALSRKDGLIEIWDIVRGLRKAEFMFSEPIVEISIHDSEKYVSALGESGKLYLLDDKLAVIRSISTNDIDDFFPLKWSRQGGRLIHWIPSTDFLLYAYNTTGRDGKSSSFLLNVNNGDKVSIFSEERSRVNISAVSSDGRILAFAMEKAGIRMWDLAEKSWFYSLSQKGERIFDLKFVPGTYDLIASTSVGVELWKYVQP